jgi:hypothetical protein
MKSIENLDSYSTELPLVADDVVELHAARLLLLLRECGYRGRLNGLTKLAKLDFFVRYPGFFQRVCDHLKEAYEAVPDATESTMVRFHYGPWDRRYYHVLAYLESRALIMVAKDKDSFSFTLTDLGKDKARALSDDPSFRQLVSHMQQVRRVLGSKSGSTLKSLIYEVFEEEVAQKHLGEAIEP